MKDLFEQRDDRAALSIGKGTSRQTRFDQISVWFARRQMVAAQVGMSKAPGKPGFGDGQQDIAAKMAPSKQHGNHQQSGKS